jgi:serine/threonine-protein kinase
LFAAATYTQSAQRLEELAYASAAHFLPPPKLAPSVAVAAIDAQALQRLGPWPWPRDKLARVIERLRRLKVRSIGLMLPLSEAETPAALEGLVTEAQQADESKVVEWLARLDADEALGNTIAASGNVLVVAEYGERSQLEATGEAPSGVSLTAVEVKESLRDKLLQLLIVSPSSPTVAVRFPVDVFMRQAAGVGLTPSLRTERQSLSVSLAVPVEEQAFPSLVTRLAARALGVGPEKIRLVPERGILFGDRLVGTGAGFTFYPLPGRGDGHPPEVPVFSLGALWDGGEIEKRLRDATVLVGITETQLAPRVRGPGGGRYTPVTWHAFALASLLGDSQIQVTPWFSGVQRALVMVFAAYLLVLPARLRGGDGLLASLALGIFVLNAGLVALLSYQLWLPVVVPAMFLLTTHAALAVRRRMQRWSVLSREDLSQARLALAGSCQARGDHDQAFLQLRRAPSTDQVMDGLYQLAVTFEDKRQFKKALAVYEHAVARRRAYRDMRERRARLRALLDKKTPDNAGRAVSAAETVLLSESGMLRSDLGHYHLERELGRGAMGVVYLATDRKLQRRVALKTLALSDEFEDEALQEAEQRFTREAAAAARLNHPHIVTIYETGRAQDLAYIAMDYVEGDTLEAVTHPEHLLPVWETLSIGVQVADALAYAHDNGIVHRDIKPSNIIYSSETGVVKVTDFGIARLLNDQRTRTGAVLGTPSYMSPEQAAGKEVDGRSDLFSLAVTLYQLLTGRLPFVGDSLANVIYRIATERPIGVSKLRTGLNRSISRVINRALQKDPGRRFSTGQAMAEALRKCQQQVKNDSRRRRRC